jgi:hypothetical protein
VVTIRRVRLGPALALALTLIPSGVAQSQSNAPALSDSATRFWGHFFNSIASPDESSKELAIREAMVVEKFGLNSGEAAALHAVAVQCYAASVEMRQQVNAILAGNNTLSGSDQAALTALVAAQKQQIAVWATALLSQFRPLIVSRIEKVIH